MYPQVPIPKGPEVVPVKSTWRRSTPTNVPPSEPTKCPLEECIAKFAGEEILDGENMFTCEMCKEKRKCTKKLSIFKYPRILVIHIMRFRYNEASREKLSTDVKFPLRGLSLSPYLSVDRPNGTISPPPRVAVDVMNDSNNSSVMGLPIGRPSSLKKSQSQSSVFNPIVVPTSPTQSPPIPTPIPTPTSPTVDKNHSVAGGIVDSIVERVEEVFHNLTAKTPTVLTVQDPEQLSTANAVNVVTAANDGPIDNAMMDEDSQPATPTTKLPSSERSPSTKGNTTTSDMAVPFVTTDGSIAGGEVGDHTIPSSSSPSAVVGSTASSSFNADLFPPMYDLIGVSNHCGTLNGGHYVAHVDTNQNKSYHHKSSSFPSQQQRNQQGEEMDTNHGLPPHPMGTSNSNSNRKEDEEEDSQVDSRWVCFNDDHVSLASTSSVVGPSAYVLFYRLRET